MIGLMTSKFLALWKGPQAGTVAGNDNKMSLDISRQQPFAPWLALTLVDDLDDGRDAEAPTVLPANR